MKCKTKLKILNSEKGISLIITFFIMIVILSVVLSVSTLLYSQVKVIRNIGDSMVSFYVADSGIEKVIYYDRQVIPQITVGETSVSAKRGLCSIFDSCTTAKGGDLSVYCDATPPNTTPVVAGSGCDPASCDNCTVVFSTAFDNKKNSRKYNISATINGADLNIQSTGIFGSTERKVEINSTPIAQ